jgi:hypothetical protein
MKLEEQPKEEMFSWVSKEHIPNKNEQYKSMFDYYQNLLQIQPNTSVWGKVQLEIANIKYWLKKNKHLKNI